MYKRHPPKIVEHEYPYASNRTSQDQLFDYYKYIMDNRSKLYTNADVEIPIYNITGYTVDPLRTTCQRIDEGISPYNYFINNSKTLSKGNLEEQDKEIWSQVKGCGAFPLQWAVYFYTKYKPKTVLDPCSGWGERLTGAILCGVDYYCGVDPHIPLKFYYQRMIDQLEGSTECKFIQQQFEKTSIITLQSNTLKNKKFDMVITSPPYSNLEQYGEVDTRTEEQWKSKFLYPMLDKAWTFTDQGGIMIMFMPGENVTYVASMIRYMRVQLNILSAEKISLSASTAYIWIKEKGEQRMTDPNKVTIVDNKIYTGKTSFSLRATEKYIGTFTDNIYYVAMGKDQAMIDLIRSKQHKKNITLYVKKDISRHRYTDELLEEKGSNKITIKTYDITYYAQVKEVKDIARRKGGFFIDFALNNAEYESCLRSIVGPSIFNIIKGEVRIWIFDVTLVLTRVLLDILPSATILLCIPHTNYNINEIVPEDRQRVNIYNGKIKEFPNIIKEFSYPKDYVLVEGEP